MAPQPNPYGYPPQFYFPATEKRFTYCLKDGDGWSIDLDLRSWRFGLEWGGYVEIYLGPITFLRFNRAR